MPPRRVPRAGYPRTRIAVRGGSMSRRSPDERDRPLLEFARLYERRRLPDCSYPGAVAPNQVLRGTRNADVGGCQQRLHDLQASFKSAQRLRVAAGSRESLPQVKLCLGEREAVGRRARCPQGDGSFECGQRTSVVGRLGATVTEVINEVARSKCVAPRRSVFVCTDRSAMARVRGAAPLPFSRRARPGATRSPPRWRPGQINPPGFPALVRAVASACSYKPLSWRACASAAVAPCP